MGTILGWHLLLEVPTITAIKFITARNVFFKGSRLAKQMNEMIGLPR